MDDLKTAQCIYTEEDIESFQIDLDTLYKWGYRNNCVFNEDKFQVLRYGKCNELKRDTLYFSPDMNSVIEEVDNCRDIGVQLQNDRSFDVHIDKVVKKCRIRRYTLGPLNKISV